DMLKTSRFITLSLPANWDILLTSDPMGRLVLTVFLICGFLCAAAQNNSVRLTLNILPPYSTSLTDYRPSVSGPGKLIVTIQNLGSSQQRVYIRAEIRGEDNGVRIY